MKFLKSQMVFVVLQTVFAIVSLTAHAQRNGRPEPYPGPGGELPPRPSFKLICGANGNNFQPYDQIHDILIGKEGYGYAQVSGCQAAIIATSQTREPVVCNWNGNNYQPYNIFTNVGIGREGYGYANSNDCNETVRLSERNLICTWSGNNWSMFAIDQNSAVGRVEGNTYYGYANINDCRESARQARHGKVCSWNGSGYQPYHIRTNEAVGRVGVATLAECIQMIRQ